MSYASSSVIPPRDMERLIAALDSLIDGEAAAERLVAAGPAAAPWLERFLLDGPARTIALPRCRAVHALGDLGAQHVLLAYFRQHRRPSDPAVLFAEDAVRSAAAEELAKHPSEEVYETLLDASRVRPTNGLIRALSEFARSESIPVLFAALDDDLCREEARAALRRVKPQARAYAALLLRGKHPASIPMTASLRERRAVLQLLREFGTDADCWPILREYLEDPDPDSVIAVAGTGFAAGPVDEYSNIVSALFRISSHLNWMQEDEVTRLLEAHAAQARPLALRLCGEAAAKGEQPNWLSPRWRILRHLLGNDMKTAAHG